MIKLKSDLQYIKSNKLHCKQNCGDSGATDQHWNSVFPVSVSPVCPESEMGAHTAVT